MSNGLIKCMLAFVFMGVLPPCFANMHKTSQHISQPQNANVHHTNVGHHNVYGTNAYNTNAQGIVLNALKREYYGDHIKTLGHRYKPAYHYSNYRKLPMYRYVAMVTKRYNSHSARSYWP